MSAYTETKTDFRDHECLMAALREIGSTPLYHPTAVRLEDYQGKQRPDRANIVIPRAQVGQAANDIGFIKQANGTYTVIVSEYDRNYNFKAENLSELKRRYNLKVAEKTCLRQGLRVVSRTEKTVNGKLRTIITTQPT